MGLPHSDQELPGNALNAPEPMDISGRMPTIYEDDVEGDEDAFVCEVFYDELTTEWTEEKDWDYDKLEEF